jgi:hypothetical protein
MLFDTLDEPVGDHYMHSFMRNLTNGSKFSLCMGDHGHRSLVLVCADLTTGKECYIGRCTGTVSQEADQFFGLAGADGCRAAILSYLSGNVESLLRVLTPSAATVDASYFASVSVCLGGVQ